MREFNWEAYERWQEPKSSLGFYSTKPKSDSICEDCGDEKAIVCASFELRQGELSSPINLGYRCAKERGIDKSEA